MANTKKIYFLSDFHLGAPDQKTSLEREKRIVGFLDNIKNDAEALFILGDLFDFWFEYKYVVPKGFVRILGKLGEISDMGVPIHFFVGNHDMWMKDYFTKELNINVYHHPKVFEWQGKRFFIGHGDGLGPGDHGYKFVKKIFRNKIAQFLFGILPPAIGIGLANYFSRKSRAKAAKTDEVFLGEEKEWLISLCKDKLNKEHFDYFVFGHRHLPLDVQLNDNSRYINLGDWIKYFSYAELSNGNMTLAYHQK